MSTPTTNDYDHSQLWVRLPAHLDRLWAGRERIKLLGLANNIAEGLVDHVSAIRYLIHAHAGRPLLYGLVGGASCGKSTLFGSLVGRAISRIHYQPHSSLGPIVWAHRRFRDQLLGGIETGHGDAEQSRERDRRFLPQLVASEIVTGAEPVVGAVRDVMFHMHDDQTWSHAVLMDLPDITSESARREGWLVRRILPWLDLVIWMVDPNDYLFEDLYIDLIDEVAAFGQRSIVVVNDIHGQTRAGDAALLERIARFRADASFVLPRLECTQRDPYPLFRAEPEFCQLRTYLQSQRDKRSIAPLIARVRSEAMAVLQQNSDWSRLVREFETSSTRLVARERKRIVATAPLLAVLPQAAQDELERLRNRFSLVHHGLKLYRAIRNPAKVVGQATLRKLQLTADDLDTEPLYRHLVGALKEFGVELHRKYLESRYVQELQRRDPNYVVRGTFDPATLDFRSQLDAMSRHLFDGAQQMLSDPSMLKDRRFQFVLGTSGVALVFLAAQSLLGLVGVTILFGKGLTALAAVLSPELARILPLDRMSRLAGEAREMLANVVDDQLKAMVTHYAAGDARFLEPNDPLLSSLETIRAGLSPMKDTEA